MFSYEIYEIFKNIYFQEHLRTTASEYWEATWEKKKTKNEEIKNSMV